MWYWNSALSSSTGFSTCSERSKHSQTGILFEKGMPRAIAILDGNPLRVSVGASRYRLSFRLCEWSRARALSSAGIATEPATTDNRRVVNSPRLDSDTNAGDDGRSVVAVNRQTNR